MSSTDPASLQRAEALRYAWFLDWGTRAGLVVLVGGFAAYLSGWVAPLVSLQDLPALWSQPVAVYLAQSGAPTGWGWSALLGKADMFNLLGIGILAGSSLPPLLSLLVLYSRRRDWPYAGLCAALAVVLVLAASGVLTGGH